MTLKPSDHPQDWHEKRIQELKRERSGETARGQPESPQSRETFAQREKRPGEVGLANEARPGLGTRADDTEKPAVVEASPRSKRRPRRAFDDNSQPRATPYAYDEPRPEPREQAPDSMAHEQERSTGASGHMGI